MLMETSTYACDDIACAIHSIVQQHHNWRHPKSHSQGSSNKQKGCITKCMTLSDCKIWSIVDMQQSTLVMQEMLIHCVFSFSSIA